LRLFFGGVSQWPTPQDFSTRPYQNQTVIDPELVEPGLQTMVGLVEIWRCENPFQAPASGSVGYVVRMRDPIDDYKGPRIPMLITVLDKDEPDAERIRQHPPRQPEKWDGHGRRIDTVYADIDFRGRDREGVTPPVAVGRRLLELGAFDSHSPERTEAGDRWARCVGGQLPPRISLHNEETLSSNAASVIAALNAPQQDR
jgi:hypothetical protein